MEDKSLPFQLAFSITLNVTTACVELHGFRGLYVLSQDGYQKWVYIL